MGLMDTAVSPKTENEKEASDSMFSNMHQIFSDYENEIRDEERRRLFILLGFENLEEEIRQDERKKVLSLIPLDVAKEVEREIEEYDAKNIT